MDEKYKLLELALPCSKDLIPASDSCIDSVIAEAFNRHFGYDYALADKMDLQHLVSVTAEGTEVHTLQYRHETFLDITDYKIDCVLCDENGVKATMKMKYKFI